MKPAIVVMRKAFAKSIKNAPTKETTSHARGDGPCLPAKDNILTNAFGVAPRPKPMAPAPSITAS